MLASRLASPTEPVLESLRFVSLKSFLSCEVACELPMGL
jgi:hypothetical protein